MRRFAGGESQANPIWVVTACDGLQSRLKLVATSDK